MALSLKITKRDTSKKSFAKDIKKRGDIPAVVYADGVEPQAITVSGVEFKQHLDRVTPGHLPTTIFTFDLDGKSVQALIKDIQYNIITYAVEHIDFQLLHADKPINVKVPIQFVGASECPGVKSGGVIRTVIRHFRLRCVSPSAIPNCVQLDVSKLHLKQSVRLSGIVLPEGVTPLVDTKEVAAVIVKR
jgi:large subunit ribosomal protein L25